MLQCPKTVSSQTVELPPQISIRIYRPLEMGSYPAGTFPLLSFSHGNRQNGQYYSDAMGDLARIGYIIASIFGLPETQLEQACGSPDSDGCHAWALMQTTFRLPVSLMCNIEDGFYLSQIEEIAIRFSGTDGIPSIVMIDDLEIRSTPGELDEPVECRCPS